MKRLVLASLFLLSGCVATMEPVVLPDFPQVPTDLQQPAEDLTPLSDDKNNLSDLLENSTNNYAKYYSLKEKYEARMLFAHAGGMWRAGPELQTTPLTCPGEDAVILDLYENPVRVDTKELLAQSQQHWQEQMTAWLVEYEQTQQQR